MEKIIINNEHLYMIRYNEKMRIEKMNCKAKNVRKILNNSGSAKEFLDAEAKAERSLNQIKEI